MKRGKSRYVAGLTLAEILVVLSIFAILGALFFPRLHHTMQSTRTDMIADQIADECYLLAKEARQLSTTRWILFEAHGYSICDAQKKPLRKVVLSKDIGLRVYASNDTLSHTGNGFCVTPEGRWSRYGRLEVHGGQKNSSELIVSSEGYVRKKT